MLTFIKNNEYDNKYFRVSKKGEILTAEKLCLECWDIKMLNILSFLLAAPDIETYDKDRIYLAVFDQADRITIYLAHRLGPEQRFNGEYKIVASLKTYSGAMYPTQERLNNQIAKELIKYWELTEERSKKAKENLAPYLELAKTG